MCSAGEGGRGFFGNCGLGGWVGGGCMVSLLLWADDSRSHSAE